MSNVTRRRLHIKMPPEVEKLAQAAGHVWVFREPSAYTEVKRVVDGQVKVTVCCCEAAGATRKGCSIVSGNKTPCRCFCHSTKLK